MADHLLTHPIKGSIPISELDESEAILILASLPNLGPIKLRGLLAHFGTAKEALLANSLVIADLFDSQLALHWQNWPDRPSWRSNLALVAQEGVKLVCVGDSDYPSQLLKLADPPPLLYAKGDAALARRRSIAIVGTRQASLYGMEMAKQFAEKLAALGYVIVSGLARGIDTAAHLGALEAGDTLAVIGSGLGNIYPAENRNLSCKIAKQGCLLSEFPMSTPPDRQNFPQRNRIVAAISDAVLLIEAPIKSGAMLTMRRGWHLQKRLFALPGRVDSPSFRGNHALIKNREAELVEEPEEIVTAFENLFPNQASLSIAPAPQRRIALDKEEEKLLQSFPPEEISIDILAELCQLPISTLNTLLMSLVLKGLIKEFPGKVYKKKPR